MSGRYFSVLILVTVIMLAAFPSVSFPYFLPDTGQSLCYNSSGGTIACGAPGSADAQDGSYSLHPVSLTNNADGLTVTDNNTGLMWQKYDSGATPQYTWDQAVAACNSAATAGLSGWRLPSKQELLSIVNYSYPPLNTAGVSINPAYFPATQLDWYWTSTVLAANATYAWYVDFGGGGKTEARPKTDVNPIRCVRGTQLNGPSLLNHNDGTATDTSTGLMWMTGETAAGDWAGALSYCESSPLANYSDWRVPDVKEFDSLADASLVFTMPSTIFPNIHDFFYWTATTNSRTPANAWSITSSSGYVNNNTVKTATYIYTRCVRGGQSGGGVFLTINPVPPVSTVYTIPSGIDCGTTCSALYPTNSVVALSILPDIGVAPNWPYFNAWTGDADCTDGLLTMDVSKTCSAEMFYCTGDVIFLVSDQVTPARSSINQAHSTAQTTDTILMIAVHFQESVDFNLGKTIDLLGGSNCALTDLAPYPFTFITGSITVSSGSVTFENIIIM